LQVSGFQVETCNLQLKTGFGHSKLPRSYPDRPLVGVGGVIIHDGRALIVQRGSEPRRGEWTVPGGLLELGETLRAATEREVFEETGLIVKPGPVLEVIDSIDPDTEGRTEYHFVLIDFLCELISGDLKPASDVSDARWIAPVELDATPLIGSTAQVLRKGFEIWNLSVK
jgi:8-oxo-dGTP diphosphatase